MHESKESIVAVQATRDYRRAIRSIHEKRRSSEPAEVLPSKHRYDVTARSKVLEAAYRLAEPGTHLSSTQVVKESGLPRGTVQHWMASMRKESPSPWVWTFGHRRTAPVRDLVIALVEKTPRGETIWLDEIEAVLVGELKYTKPAVTKAIKVLQQSGAWHWPIARRYKKRGRKS